MKGRGVTATRHADSTTTPSSPSARLVSLTSALYCTQYLGIGFVMTGLIVVFREQGVDLATLGAITSIGSLWAIKFLWAPLVDRYGVGRLGHYRSWLAGCQSAMIFVILLMLFTPPTLETFWSIVSLTAMFVLFSATQDIAADALVVRVVPQEQRGAINGVQVAAGYAGNVIGGGVLIVLYDKLGWITAILTLAALTAIALALILNSPEAQRTAPVGKRSLGQAYASMSFLWKSKRIAIWAFAIIPLLNIGASVVYYIANPALVDNGWSLTKIGVVLNIVASAIAILGSAACGFFTSRFGLKRPLFIGNSLAIVSVLLLLPMFSGQRNDLMTIAGVCLYMTAYSMTSVIIYTINMEYCREESAGSDFTVLTCLAMLFSFVAASPLLVVADRFGYVPVAVIGMAAMTAGTVLAFLHVKKYHPCRTTTVKESVSV